MADYPDMRELARHATEDYSRIDSLDQIKPPYPAQGTPNWWALRLRYEQLLMARIRRDRANSAIPCRVNEGEATAAKWAALGNEQADSDYQSYVKPAAEIYARQRASRDRKDWLQGQVEAATRKIA